MSTITFSLTPREIGVSSSQNWEATMQTHDNKHVMPLLSALLAAIFLAAILTSGNIIEPLTKQLVNLSQIQTRQALAKLAAIKTIVGAKEAKPDKTSADYSF
jgi:hypothetical protein